MSERAVYLKVGVKDQEAFRAALQAMGKDGESMLRRIETAAVPASRSLVAVSAAASELRTSLTAAGSSLGPLSAGLGALGGAAGTVGLGIAALGVGFIALTKRALEAGDSIGDAADALGLSVKAYQQFSGAAKLAGVSAEQFEAGIKLLQDRLANAVAKGGDAAAPFRTLGVAFQTATGQARSAEDVFLELAEAFKGIENPAERVNLALDVLGKSGAKFLPLFAEGAEGIRNFADEAEALGLVIDERLIRDAGKANDRLEILSSVIGTKLTQAFLNVAPYVDKFGEWILRLAGDESANARAQIEALANRLGLVRQELKALDEAQATGGRAGALLQPRIDQLKAEIRTLEETRSGLVRGLRSDVASAPAPANVKAPGELTKAEIDELTKAYRDLKGGVDPVAKATQEYEQRLDVLNKAVTAGIVGAKEELQVRAQIEKSRDEAIDKATGEIERRKALADLDVDLEQRLIRLRNESDKRNRSLDDYIKLLEAEVGRAGESETAHKVREAILKAEAKLVDDLGRKTRDLTDYEKQRITAAVEGREAFDKAQKEAEKFARDQERLVERSADKLVDQGADLLFDALEGRTSDLWATFEREGKRAFARLLAEQFLRPIAINLVSSVLGVPQKQATAGLDPLSIASSANQAKSGFDFLSNLPSTLQNLFSPNNAIASAFPSIFGQGITAGGSIGAFTSEAAMQAALQAGVPLTAGPLAGLAPFLPVLAIALPLLLSSFLGGKKSVGPNGNAIINYEVDADGRLSKPGGLEVGGVGADNGGDKDYARRMGEAAVKGVNAIVDRLGARLRGVPGAGQSNQLEVGYFAEGNKHFSIVGGEKSEFDSAEAAVADFIKRTLQKADIEGITGDVRTALEKTTAKSVEDLGKDIDYAANFRRTVDLAAAGADTRAGQLLGFRFAAEDAGRAQRTRLRDFVSDADRLYGADSSQAADARATARRQALALVGLGPDAEGDAKPLEGMAATIAATRENFQALKDALIDTGLSADEAQRKIDEGLVKTFGKMAKEAEKALADQILAAESPAAFQATKLLEAQKKRRDDYIALRQAAGDTSVDTSSVDKLSTLELRGALLGQSTAALAEVEAELRKLGELTPEAAAALAFARDYAELVAGQGALQVELATLANETAEAEKRATDARADYVSALNREISTLDATAERFKAFAEQLAGFRSSLLIGELSPLSRTDRYAEATRQRNEIAARARLGDERAIEQLQAIVEAQLRASRDVNASGNAYATDFAENMQILADVETVASRTARIAGEQRDLLRDQLEELTGQSEDLKTIAEAAAAWQAAQAAASGGSGNGSQYRSLFDQLATTFGQQYGAARTDAERQAIYSATASQRDQILAAAPSDVIQEILRDYYQGSQDSGAVFARLELLRRGVVPRYAGGTGAGTAEGLAWVGEAGPELAYFNAPTRIYPAAESARMTSRGSDGANVVRAIGDLTAETRGLRADLRAHGRRLESLESERAVGTYDRRGGRR